MHFDAGSDAPTDVGVSVDGDTGSTLSPEASPYLGGPCVDDAQCNDSLACTYDSCDQTLGRCLNVPDRFTLCQDGMYCDGMELCVPGHGCEPGAVVSCDNGNECQIATCVETTKSCSYQERDVDRDGDPDAHCLGGHDCNDLDPDVSSLHAEVCANGIDDNCNGLVDEQPCVLPQGVTCLGAVLVTAPGTFPISTLGANDTFDTSCSVTTPTAAQNVVVAITVPGMASVDLQVWASSPSTEVAVAIDGSCGLASTELACGSAGGANERPGARAERSRRGPTSRWSRRSPRRRSSSRSISCPPRPRRRTSTAGARRRSSPAWRPRCRSWTPRRTSRALARRARAS